MPITGIISQFENCLTSSSVRLNTSIDRLMALSVLCACAHTHTHTHVEIPNNNRHLTLLILFDASARGEGVISNEVPAADVILVGIVLRPLRLLSQETYRRGRGTVRFVIITGDKMQTQSYGRVVISEEGLALLRYWDPHTYVSSGSLFE